MNYAVGAAFNLDEMFMNFDTSKLKMSCKDVEKITGDLHRMPLIKRIFRECLKEIINDVIDENATFYLPTGGRESSIHIKRYSNEDFAKGRRNGKWQDVDFLESNFSGNQMVLTMDNGKTTKDKPIYLNKEFKDRITENTNKGKQYC